MVEGNGWTRPLPEPRRTWALTVRLTSVRDMPGEDGSAGPRDGVVRPLVHVRDGAGLARACPLLEIDRLRGPGAGGRWVFAPTDAALSAEVIRAAVERALEAAVEISARPIRAAVDPGEAVRIRVSVGRPGAPGGGVCCDAGARQGPRRRGAGDRDGATSSCWALPRSAPP